MAIRVASYKGTVATFRTTGVASANINLLSIYNKTGSGVLLAIRDIIVQTDVGGDSSTVRTVRMSRITTAPTDGTVLSKSEFDSAQSSSSSVEFRGATASDGGAATTLTSTPGTYGQAIFGIRSNTAVEQRIKPNSDLGLTNAAVDDPTILRENQGFLFTIVESGSTAMYYVINIVFEEFKYQIQATGQAQADIKTVGRGYGQAQASIATGDALLAVGDAAAPTASDASIKDRLASLGFRVTYISDETAEPGTPSTYELVVIAESVASATIGNKYKTWAVPGLWMENGAWQAALLSGAGAAATASQTQIDDAGSGHTIAGGLTGTQTIFSAASNVYRTTGANLGSVVILTALAQPTQAFLWVIDAGDQMPGDGSAAPARRAAFGVDNAGWANLNATGLGYFDRTIAWLIAGVAHSRAYGQAQADIKAIGQSYGQAQADIKDVNQAYAQAQADVKAINNAFAQAQADVKATYSQPAQANADIKNKSTAYSTPYGQANADIKAKSTAFSTPYGQAQATIRSGAQVFAQAQADIKAIGRGYGQSQADIKNQSTKYSTPYGQAQAQIIVLDGYGRTVAGTLPLAYWRLDDLAGSTRFRDTQNGHSLVTVGTPTFEQASLTFTSQNDAVKFTQSTGDGGLSYIDGATLATNISLVAWYKMEDTPGQHRHIAGFRDDIDADFYLLQLSGTQNIEARFRYTDGHNELTNTTGPLAAGSIVMLALVINGADLKFYVNGVQVDNQTTTGSPIGSLSEFGIGKGAAFAFENNSTIDEVALWDRSLTPTEITSIFNAGWVHSGQAQADIKAKGNGLGQAQSDIKAKGNGLGQAQSDIKAKGNGLGQAQATIRGNTFGQAQAMIYIPQYIPPVADVSNDGWVGVVI